MKKIWKYYGIPFLVILFLLNFFPIGKKDPVEEMDIYLVSNDIHVGIVLPKTNKVYDWTNFLIKDNFPEDIQDMSWIQFGWGDKRFYFEMPTMDQFSLELALDALFLPDPAVMHVELLPVRPEPSSYVRRVRISYSTYRKMVDEIKSWFILRNHRPILIRGKGFSWNDQFFEARGSYSLLKTCNAWTSDIFAASDLRHPLWSPTKYGMEFLWNP